MTTGTPRTDGKLAQTVADGAAASPLPVGLITANACVLVTLVAAAKTRLVLSPGSELGFPATAIFTTSCLFPNLRPTLYLSINAERCVALAFAVEITLLTPSYLGESLLKHISVLDRSHPAKEDIIPSLGLNLAVLRLPSPTFSAKPVTLTGLEMDVSRPRGSTEDIKWVQSNSESVFVALDARIKSSSDEGGPDSVS